MVKKQNKKNMKKNKKIITNNENTFFFFEYNSTIDSCDVHHGCINQHCYQLEANQFYNPQNEESDNHQNNQNNEYNNDDDDDNDIDDGTIEWSQSGNFQQQKTRKRTSKLGFTRDANLKSSDLRSYARNCPVECLESLGIKY
jgi:hypothetical protein